MNWFAPRGFSNIANVVLMVLVAALCWASWQNLSYAARKQASNEFVLATTALPYGDPTAQCSQLQSMQADMSPASNATRVLVGPVAADQRAVLARPLDTAAQQVGRVGVFYVSGERVLGQWFGDDSCGWYLFGESLAPYEQPIRQALLAILAAGLAAALAIWWIGQLAQKRLQADLVRMLADCQRIGDGELGHRVSIDAGSEDLRAIAHEVNGMVGRLALLVDNMRTVSVTLAHDMRNYITHAKVRLRQLRDDLPTDDQAAVEPAMTSLSQLDALAREVARLAASRSDKSKAQAIDLADVAKDAVMMFADTFEDEGVALNADLEAAPAKVNQTLVMEALVNLIGNALKYGGSGEIVTVRTGTQDGHAFVEVIDRGPGVPEDQRDKIFRLDHRLDCDAEADGHGFGLAIARLFTRMDGGDLAVEAGNPSDEPQGARFRIAFPYAERRVSEA